MGIHSVSLNLCYFQSICTLQKQSTIILMLERWYRIIYLTFRCCPSHFSSSLHNFLDLHIRRVEYWYCNEPSFIVCRLLVHAFTDNPSSHYGRLHVLLYKSNVAWNRHNPTADPYLKQIMITLKIIRRLNNHIYQPRFFFLILVSKGFTIRPIPSMFEMFNNLLSPIVVLWSSSFLSILRKLLFVVL